MTTRNGQPLAYDALSRQTNWQNTATSPTQTATYAYNGEGDRVQQVTTKSGTATTTNYIGTNEEVSITGSATTTTKYYNAGGVASVTNVNGTLSYLVKDFLGSTTMALDTTGNVIATTLYAPYGTTRYSTGTMPTTRSYTSMVSDSSGLFYDHARYYDGGVGQFTSADTEQGPNRYGYVFGNPATYTDPTGHWSGWGGYIQQWWTWAGNNLYIHWYHDFVQDYASLLYLVGYVLAALAVGCLKTGWGWTGCEIVFGGLSAAIGFIGVGLSYWDTHYCHSRGVGLRELQTWWGVVYAWPTC